ncbi:MAG: malonyl-CoA synthase [Chromatiales bacterium]|nr:MAG: malonyl-CoA synthase [Chromatiales bacterium]
MAAGDNLYGLLRAGFADRLDQSFLVLPGAGTRTFADLDALSATYAGVLRELGLAAGDRAVVQIGKSPEALALYLACLRTGVVYIPLNTAYTSGELRHFLVDARPRVYVCPPASAEALQPVVDEANIPNVLTLDEDGTGSLAEQALVAKAAHELAPRNLDDVAAILYTSGTTGRSKGAMLTIGNLASNAQTLVKLWGWRDDDVLLHALPIFHVHGLFVALHCAMLGGSTVLFHPRFDVAAVRAALPHATVMMGVPTFYTRLLEDPDFGAADCRNMRLFISGSAPLLASICEDFAKRTGHRILERYGMTEAGMITSNPLDGERVPGTVGYALPGVDLRVCAGDADLPPGEVGDIQIRGPNVFAGYWQMPEKTAAEFTADGYLRTGDLGTLAADGRLTLVGRARDLIISGGYNIYPKEIERRLDELPGVRESAVIGVPHPDLGEAVVAVIVADDNTPPDEPTLLAGLGDQLARFKQPRRLFFVGDLPRNAMGKVEKQRLRRRFRDAFAS